MEIGHFNEQQARAAVRFLITVATVHHKIQMSELEATCINAIQHNIYLCDYALDKLNEISENELAKTILDEKQRLELVRAGMFLIAAESHIDSGKTQVLKSFAGALKVQENDLDGLEEMSHDHMEMATLDFMRRKAHPKYSMTDPLIQKTLKDHSLESLWKYLMPLTSATCKQDIKLANRYKNLKNYPINTVGYHLYEYYEKNNFKFPGEVEGDNPEFPMIIHDISHVLGDYQPTPEEEMEVLAFTAGYRHGRGFDAVFQAIVHFHLGLKIDAAFQPYQDRFQPEPFFKALKRGNQMNVDLFHNWDPWSIMDKDINEVRENFNIQPKTPNHTDN
ncbi:MAG: hypothetical protein KJO52_07750 [Maribacter sp.]|nr:hypothetical protein [Maribacter sp.]